MPDAWRIATLQQARADYALFQQLQADSTVPQCHKLHLLQMATEKLGKYFVTHPGAQPERTHKVFVNFVQTAKTNSQLRQVSRFASHNKQYISFVKSLEPLARQIESLSPDGPDHPNPEYPWEQNGQVMSPLDYDWADVDLSLSEPKPKMLKMLQFLNDCFSLP